MTQERGAIMPLMAIMLISDVTTWSAYIDGNPIRIVE